MSLLKAIQQIDILTVTQLIADGIDLNQPCSNGELPLKIAIMQLFEKESKNVSGLLDIIDLLIAHGANPSQVLIGEDQEGLLIYLSKQGDSKFLDSIFNRFSKKNNKEQRALAQKLIEKLLTYPSILTTINVRDKEGRTPLLISLSQRNIELAKILLTADADPRIANNYGQTPFHSACSLND